MGFPETILRLAVRHLAAAISLIISVTIAITSISVSAQHRAQTNSQVESMAQLYNSGDLGARYNQPALSPNRRSSTSSIVQLWPATISYARETNFMDYVVDPNLGFGIDYTYSFTFNLGARRTDGEETHIPNGWYKLNMAVVLKEAKNIFRPAAGLKQESPYDRYVTSTSMFVKATGGRFSRSVTLRFPNITATTLINHLYIELIPLKKECSTKDSGEVIPCIQLSADNRQPDPSRSIIEPMQGIEPYLVEMPFVPFLSSGRSERNPDDAPSSLNPFFNQSLSDYVASARIYRERKLLYSQSFLEPSEYARQFRLHYVSSEDSSVDRLSKQWIPRAEARVLLEQIFAQEGIGALALNENLKKLMPVLCALMFERNQQYQKNISLRSIRSSALRVVAHRIAKCAENPEDIMTLSRVTHIRKLDGQRAVERIFSRSPSFNMMVNFMVNRARSADVFYNWTFKPQALLLKPLEAFGLAIHGVDWSYSINNSLSRSSSESMIGGMVTSLDFNANALNLPLASAVSCLQVVPKAVMVNTFLDTRDGAENGLYICSPERRNTSIQELYVHVFERARDTSTVDAFDPVSQSVNFSLRGERDISTFFYLIRSNITAKHDSKILPFETMKKAEQYFHSTPPTYPRLVIHPLTFNADHVPSFSQKLFGAYKEAFVTDSK